MKFSYKYFFKSSSQVRPMHRGAARQNHGGKRLRPARADRAARCAASLGGRGGSRPAPLRSGCRPRVPREGGGPQSSLVGALGARRGARLALAALLSLRGAAGTTAGPTSAGGRDAFPGAARTGRAGLCGAVRCGAVLCCGKRRGSCPSTHLL